MRRELKTVHFSSCTILGYWIEGSRLSLVMIYGKVTALLKELQLKTFFFSWSGFQPLSWSGSGNPFRSEKPPMTTYLNQMETVPGTKGSLPPIFCSETLLCSPHSVQMICSLPSVLLLLRTVFKMCQNHPSPLYSDLKNLFRKLLDDFFSLSYFWWE